MKNESIDIEKVQKEVKDVGEKEEA